MYSVNGIAFNESIIIRPDPKISISISSLQDSRALQLTHHVHCSMSPSHLGQFYSLPSPALMRML